MQLAHALRVSSRSVVALVGGGGKTTLLFRLADELAGAGQRVVTSTTTHLAAAQILRAPARLIAADADALLAQLGAALAEHRHVWVGGGAAVELERVVGVTPHCIDRIAAHPAVDHVLVEADGARRLPFKAPAAHEPVIPDAATLVVPVAGIDAVGQPLDGEHVYRPERIAALTGAALGEPITPALIAAVLGHAAGGGKNIPHGARVIPFINKVETPDQLAAARTIAERLLAMPTIDAVAIGAGHRADPVAEVWNRIGAVVLAAGAGRRFGALKQALSWQGEPLVRHVARQALACPEVVETVVVVGAQAEIVRAALAPLEAAAPGRLRVIEATSWAQGQSRSVCAGLDAVCVQPLPGGVLFLLSDQPGVSPALLTALIQRHRETLAPVVAPRFGGQRGNPVLFDQNTFSAFAELRGDVGAREIIAAHAGEVAWVNWPTADPLWDIDTRADADRLLARTRADR